LLAVVEINPQRLYGIHFGPQLKKGCQTLVLLTLNQIFISHVLVREH